MNEQTLIANEFAGRGVISLIAVWVIYNIAGIWLTWLVLIIMILWMLNPLFEYKLYKADGGN